MVIKEEGKCRIVVEGRGGLFPSVLKIPSQLHSHFRMNKKYTLQTGGITHVQLTLPKYFLLNPQLCGEIETLREFPDDDI